MGMATPNRAEIESVRHKGNLGAMQTDILEARIAQRFQAANGRPYPVPVDYPPDRQLEEIR